MQLNAHACGSWRGILWSNCLEALMSAIKLGFLNIEIDVSVTSDNQFVIGHDGFNGLNKRIKDLTEREYLDCKLPWNGTRFNLKTALDVLRAHPDVNVMWDFRPSVYADCAREICAFATVLDNANLEKSGIIEVCSWNDFDCVLSTGYTEIMYGLCGRGWVNGIHCTKEQLEFDMDECERRKVRYVSVPVAVAKKYPLFINRVHEYGGKVYSLGWELESNLREAERHGVDFATVDYAIPGGVIRNAVRIYTEGFWRVGRRWSVRLLCTHKIESENK